MFYTFSLLGFLNPEFASRSNKHKSVVFWFVSPGVPTGTNVSKHGFDNQKNNLMLSSRRVILAYALVFRHPSFLLLEGYFSPVVKNTVQERIILMHWFLFRFHYSLAWLLFQVPGKTAYLAASRHHAAGYAAYRRWWGLS